MDFEDELDGLYQLPLREFVGARNELAKRLRKDDREAADRVKALPKPSLTAWAVNQLASRAPDELEALITAGAEVRAAHLAAAPEQQSAAKARRGAISALLAIAEGIVAGGGQAFNRTHRRRISRTLEALSSRGPDNDEPDAGRLSQDLEPAGFDAIADLAAALQAAPPRAKKKPKPPAKTAAAPVAAPAAAATAAAKKKNDKSQAERQAEKETRRREAARRALELQLEEARQALAKLGDKVEGLSREAEQASSELETAKATRNTLSEAALEAESLAREAQARADEAGKSASRARFAAEAASAAFARAGGELEAERQKMKSLTRELEKLAATPSS